MPQHTHKKDRKYCTILGVRINSTELAEVLRLVNEFIDRKQRFVVVTPNPEIIMLAQTDPVLYSILNSADISLPDGVGLVWASKILRLKADLGTAFFRTGARSLGDGEGGDSLAAPAVSPSTAPNAKNQAESGLGSDSFFKKDTLRPLTERLSGVDVMESLVELASKHGWRVFLLGGHSGVADAAATKLKIKNEKLKIEADAGPWLGESGKPINKVEERKERKVIEKINTFRPHLLFVGFGAPKQEKWVASNYNKLQTLGTMVVGGAFDYISGRVLRAPGWVREVGLEWLFRLLVEPARWKRQLALLRFVWAILKTRLTSL